MTEYLTGDKALIEKLDSLKKKESKAAIRKGTRAGAKIVMERAKGLAPVATGKLRQSIKVRSLPRSRQYVGHRVRAQVPYAGPLEYGHNERCVRSSGAKGNQGGKGNDSAGDKKHWQILTRTYRLTLRP